MAALTIAWKEFRGFLWSPLAYIFLLVFVVVLNGAWFIWGNERGTFFSQTSVGLEGYFLTMPLALSALIPALAMKLWPDELKSGTVELLFSYPLRTFEIVLGKYLAGLYLLAIGLLLTLIVPAVAAEYGALDRGPVIGAYIASFLMGAAFLAMGLFFGALCREQVTAFIVTALFCALFVLLGDTLTNMFVPEKVGGINVHEVSRVLSFSTRFEQLGRGVVPLADVLYFVLFGGLFLLLNITVLECRKGR